jgi:hypothetical protein
MASPILLVLLFVWPRTAHADAGVPMIAVLWPWAWAAFIPVCLIETLVAKRLLSLPLLQCARLSVVANAWSTLVGIPLTWLALFLVEMGGGLGLWVSGAEPGPVWTAVLSPIGAPWLGPQARPWHGSSSTAGMASGGGGGSGGVRPNCGALTCASGQICISSDAYFVGESSHECAAPPAGCNASDLCDCNLAWNTGTAKPAPSASV